MPIKKTGKPISQQIQEFRQFRRQLPTMVGTEAVNFFKQSFRRKGFIDGGGIDKWAPRKAGAKRNKGRGLLVDTGRLRRSIRIVRKGTDYVVVGTDVPYAKVHNEGFRGIQHVRPHKRQRTITTKVRGSYNGTANRNRTATLRMNGARFNVRGFARRMNMPQRKFMGASRFFDRRIQMLSTRKLKQILKG